MTFASRMQHHIYWGPMKKPIEWSLKTVLAPWAYIASVLYHDSFWYPLNADRNMKQVLESPWGRLFQNWEQLDADADGFPTSASRRADRAAAGRRALGSRSASSAPASRKRPSLRAGGARAARGGLQADRHSCS
jgi:hypothetical protein